MRRWSTFAASAEFQKRRFIVGKPNTGGMEVSEAKRQKALEEENARLKKLLAEQMLDAVALRALLAKNVSCAPSVQGFATSQ